MTRTVNPTVYRISRGGSPIADVDSPEAIEALASSLRPGRYDVDVISALPVEGYTSRGWGVLVKGQDGSVRIER